MTTAELDGAELEFPAVASDADDTLVSARSGGSPASELVLVPAGGSFEGQVAIIGPTRIEGSVRGSLRGAGDLIVGAQGRIEGRVECESLASDGEIVGPVSVRTRARLGAGARLDGDLDAPSMTFDESAVWNGRAQIGSERLEEADAGPAGGSPDPAS